MKKGKTKNKFVEAYKDTFRLSTKQRPPECRPQHMYYPWERKPGTEDQWRRQCVRCSTWQFYHGPDHPTKAMNQLKTELRPTTTKSGPVTKRKMTAEELAAIKTSHHSGTR